MHEALLRANPPLCFCKTCKLRGYVRTQDTTMVELHINLAPYKVHWKYLESSWLTIPYELGTPHPPDLRRLIIRISKVLCTPHLYFSYTSCDPYRLLLSTSWQNFDMISGEGVTVDHLWDRKGPSLSLDYIFSIPGHGWRFDNDWNSQFPVVIYASVAFRDDWRDVLLKFLQGNKDDLVRVLSARGFPLLRDQNLSNHVAGVSSHRDFPLTLTCWISCLDTLKQHGLGLPYRQCLQ